VIRQETSYNRQQLLDTLPERLQSLNAQQRIVYDEILRSVERQDGRTFALQASGGTGKTYTVNLVLDTIRSRGDIALATAMSGIASTLLHNGRTLHSTCKVPINVNENSTCNFTKRDATGKP
jgi:Cdc6-like AAA superfamily ATPase